MTNQDANEFLQSIDFLLPLGYLEMMRHGQEQILDFEALDGKYLLLWPLDKLVGINNDYEAAKHYPGFFLIGTYEIGEACAIEKATGAIYTLPFIGSVQEDAVFVGKSVDELLAYLKEDW